MLAAGAIVLLAAAFPHVVDVPGIGGDIGATLGYVVNWRFVLLHHDYFAQFAQPSLLSHAWSLAIEEQFYLIWPLVAIGALVWRRVRPSRFAIGCAVAAALSAAWMAVLFEMGASTSRLYFGTDTRAQALLLGAAFGAAGVGRGRITSRTRRGVVAAVGLLGFAGIVTCFVLVTDRTSMLYTGGFLLAAVFAVSLVSDAAQPDASPLGRLLGVAPLVWLGRISYGIYLWHWPVVVLVTEARIGVGGVGLFGIRVAITLAVSVASYFLVEMPIRRGALRGWRFWTAVPTVAAVVVVGGLVVTAGAPRVFTPPTAARHLQPAPDTAGAPPPAAPGVPPPPTRVLVVGDSVALTLGVGLAYESKTQNLTVSNDGILGCGLLRGGQIWVDGTWSNVAANCEQWPARWASDVTVTKPQVVIVLTGTWDAFDRRINGRQIDFGSTEDDQLMLQDMRDSLDVLSAAGGGGPVHDRALHREGERPESAGRVPLGVRPPPGRPLQRAAPRSGRQRPARRDRRPQRVPRAQRQVGHDPRRPSDAGRRRPPRPRGQRGGGHLACADDRVRLATRRRTGRRRHHWSVTVARGTMRRCRRLERCSSTPNPNRHN